MLNSLNNTENKNIIANEEISNNKKMKLNLIMMKQIII